MTAGDRDLDFIAAVLPAFIDEALEQIVGIETLLLQLEDAPSDRDLLDALFRCAHTVKGSAGVFGLNDVVAFTHHVESLLDRLREGAVALTPALSTLLLQSNDQIRTLVSAAATGGASSANDLALRESLVGRLQQAAGSGVVHDEHVAESSSDDAASVVVDNGATTAGWNVSARFGADTYRNGMDPLATLLYLGTMGRIVDIVCDAEAVPALDDIDPESCHLQFAFRFETDASRSEMEEAFSFVRDDVTLTLDPIGAIAPMPTETDSVETVAAAAVMTVQPATSERSRDTGTPSSADEQRFIRVPADQLDLVINLLGELVIAGAGAALQARQTRNRELVEAHLQIGRLIEEIRNGTLQLRMVPIGETFARFRRVVRDTAGELEKDVALEIVGGDTELDKSVVERIADPLMHLVRNALDHGLEGPPERLASGKPAKGTLTLAARHDSGSVLISIVDDGRGINRERVLARAWERGLVPQGVTPSDDAIHALIFEPGFSTAEKVTNLSGRGVGMDVVRRNIEALRGTVAIHSQPGLGSRIDIRLPLTLAIIDGFLVGVGPSKFIFPLDTVVEVIETRPAAESVDARGRSVVELRGQVLPVVSLRVLYGLESAEPERVSVVVVKAGANRFGVIVDQLLGQHQTVIKPLGRMFKSLRGMSGSSILGSGEVALIFDVNSLCELAVDPPRERDATRRTPIDLVQPSSAPQPATR